LFYPYLIYLILSVPLIFLVILLEKGLKKFAQKRSFVLFGSSTEDSRKSDNLFKILYGLSLFAYVLFVRCLPILIKLSNENDAYEHGAYLGQMFLIIVPFAVLLILSFLFRLKIGLIFAAIFAIAYDAYITIDSFQHSYGALGDGLIAFLTPLVIFFLIFIGIGFGVLVWYLMELHYKKVPEERKPEQWLNWIVPLTALLVIACLAPISIDKTLRAQKNLEQMRERREIRAEERSNRRDLRTDTLAFPMGPDSLSSDSAYWLRKRMLRNR